jgi:hypothetical protein
MLQLASDGEDVPAAMQWLVANASSPQGHWVHYQESRAPWTRWMMQMHCSDEILTIAVILCLFWASLGAARVTLWHVHQCGGMRALAFPWGLPRLLLAWFRFG